MKKLLLIPFLLLISLVSIAQKPQKLTSNEIFEKVQKLNFLGTALYIAAHPDDENTRLTRIIRGYAYTRVIGSKEC